MKKIIFFFLIAASMSVQIIAQDNLTSVGPAPVSNYRVIPQEPAPFAVGTRYFIQISISPTFQFGRAFLESCSMTNIGPPFTITFPGGLVYRNGVIITWNQSSPYQMWMVDTVTGVHTLILNSLTGVPQANLTGMCWDGTTLYGVSTSLSVSQIFTINGNVCTPIGTPSTVSPGAISLMCRPGAQYSLFSHDIVSDAIHKWNKTTGVATLLGALGFDANFGQDGGCDPNDNNFYLVAYNNTAGASQLRRLDSALGSSTLLCTYTSQATGIACVPNINPYTTICRNGINVSVPDGSPAGIRDTIKMLGNTNCVVLDINVKIDTFTHTWLSDMAFTLNHNATTVALFTNRGGSGDNIIGCTFDDSAAVPISGGTPPYSGSFRPEQPLNVFNNTHSPQGNWMLHMVDNAAGDTGILKAWCITFQYSCPLGGVQQVEVPFSYRLYQNFPNPFNPVTTIKYGLPKFGKTKLVVYDVLGKVITTLVDNEFKDAGTYEVGWDASNFSSGIYFYTLESGNYKETKKMLMVK